ncbi:MAG: Hsp20/alpha crystallin family protein [Chloroflexota bacterium]
MDTSSGHEGVQVIPANVYDDGHEIVIVMPLTGITSDEITVRVSDGELQVIAGIRGPRQVTREYPLHEWSYGPYQRRIELIGSVDGGAANATHRNGVLTVALPKASRTTSATIHLERDTGSRHDQCRGHRGGHDQETPSA